MRCIEGHGKPLKTVIRSFNPRQMSKSVEEASGRTVDSAVGFENYL